MILLGEGGLLAAHGLYVLKLSAMITCGLIDKLGVFHANQISMCLDPHLN